MYKISYALFGNHSGYGAAGQSYLDALLESGEYDIRVDIIGKQITKPGISDKRFINIRQLQQKEMTDDHVQILHCVPTLQHKFKKRPKNIGFATFETFSPPSNGAINWISVLNQNDAVITPSRFNYHIFAHTRLTKPIFYIPHCLDMKMYHPGVIPMKKYDGFTFLFFGSWKLRKGYPQLLEAWFSEFDKNDGVNLVIKTDKPQIARSQIEQIRNNLGYKRKEIAPILFEDKIFDENELPQFLKSFDCLVCPTLGEGFGLPGLQCMSLGVPLIITDFSGCQDYANEETATLLSPRGFVRHECLDQYPQFRKSRWAFVSVKDVKESMRFVMDNYGDCKKKADIGSARVADNFNYSKTAALFGDMLRTVYA